MSECNKSNRMYHRRRSLGYIYSHQNLELDIAGQSFDCTAGYSLGGWQLGVSNCVYLLLKGSVSDRKSNSVSEGRWKNCDELKVGVGAGFATVEYLNRGDNTARRGHQNFPFWKLGTHS